MRIFVMSYYCDSNPTHCKTGFYSPRKYDIDSFASKVDKSDFVITRTFGLVPFIDSNKTDKTPRDTYSAFTKFFALLRDFKNVCTRALLDHYKQNPNNIGDFDDKRISHDKKNIVQTLYRNTLHLHEIPTDSNQQREYHKLHGTAKEMAFKDSFFAVKNLIVRTENLNNMISAFGPSFYPT
jgi:hypothetical protein